MWCHLNQSSRIKTQVNLQNRRYFLVFFRRRKHRQALGGHGTRDRFSCTTKVHIICLYHRRNCKTHMELLAENCAALSAHMTFREGGSVLITDYRSSRAIERAQPQISDRRELWPAMALPTSRPQSSTFSSSFVAGRKDHSF